MNKIFGIGFSKTGTTSLEEALEILGCKVCRGNWRNTHTFYLLALYINRDYDEIFRLVNYWDAFTDGPWGGTDLYLELYKKFPEAKYILTLRNPESWYQSFEKLITMFDLNIDTALTSYHANGLFGSAYFFEHIFGIKSLANNKDKIISHYQQHNEEVIRFFKTNPSKFMVFNIMKGDGWEKLCGFLNVEVPSAQFPHANKSSENPYLSNKITTGNDAYINKKKKLKLLIRTLCEKVLRKIDTSN